MAVVVPSYTIVSFSVKIVDMMTMLEANRAQECSQTYIFDLLNRKVSIRRHANVSRLHIDDDQKWVWCVSLEQLVDLQIRRPQFRTRVIPSNELFPRVDLLEHIVHRFDVVVV